MSLPTPNIPKHLGEASSYNLTQFEKLRGSCQINGAFFDWNALVLAAVYIYKVRGSALLNRKGRVSERLMHARYMLVHALSWLTRGSDPGLKWLEAFLPISRQTITGYLKSTPPEEEMTKLLNCYAQYRSGSLHNKEQGEER